MFKKKTLIITGGTGSFGNAVLNRFLNTDVKEIRIFSRDEKKQDDMRKLYNNPKIKFHIGDVRDFDSVANAMIGVDYVFHAAALKQVPSCEFFPIQAVKTNVLGAENVLRAAIANQVKKVIVLSTDKAVYPINAMGMSKALIELFEAKTEIKIIGTRHGEKKHVTLVNREEMAKAIDLPGYYRIPADTRDLNYDKYFESGEAKVAEAVGYTSENTYRLSIKEIKEKLLSLQYVRGGLGKHWQH